MFTVSQKFYSDWSALLHVYSQIVSLQLQTIFVTAFFETAYSTKTEAIARS